MRKLESAGWISKLGSQVLSLFSREEYQERVESGLISTLDGVMKWLDDPKKKDGSPYKEVYIKKMVNHYIRQYKANRPKLK